MKILLIGIIFCTTICFNAVGQKNELPELSGQVTNIPTNVVGTVTVTSSGFGKKRVKTTADAIASAIYVLLFRGIPGSQYELPMIADEAKVNNVVVQDILNGGYSSFITETIFINEVKQTRKIDGVKGNSDLYRITINCDALRRYLEKNGVIRKFGI